MSGSAGEVLRTNSPGAQPPRAIAGAPVEGVERQSIACDASAQVTPALIADGTWKEEQATSLGASQRVTTKGGDTQVFRPPSHLRIHPPRSAGRANAAARRPRATYGELTVTVRCELASVRNP